MRTLPLWLLAAVALLPAVGLAPGDFLADPLSELPVKLWAHETFARVGLLGGWIDTIAFPNAGLLNNPDPLGAGFTALVRPVVGRVAAWNALVLVLVFANMVSAWALATDLTRDRWAALTAAVAFGLTPLVLTYCVLGAISDMLQLWMWPLAIRSVLRVVRGDGDVGEAAAAGALVGLGTVASPYNLVVFASLLVPGALLLLLPRLAARPSPWIAWVRGGAACLVTFALIGGSYVLWVRTIMADPASQMADVYVQATRHAAPFPYLAPDSEHRYVAFLADYVATGKDALLAREVGSRYLRAFSPGLAILALAAWGALRRPEARGWLFVAGWCALASTGPYLPVTADVALPGPWNVAWLAPFHLVPGTKLLLEPFRYGLLVALGLGVAAAFGVAELATRARAVLAVAPVVFLAELALLSPVPFPLPSARPEIPAVYGRLDTLLGPGAILELPYFDGESDRFNRVHFLHQLVHGRPIADEVMGFAPRYLRENQFTAQLLHIEKTTGVLVVPVEAPERVQSDATALAARGFAGIVVDPEGYASGSVRDEALRLLRVLGDPVHTGERIVWRLR